MLDRLLRGCWHLGTPKPGPRHSNHAEDRPLAKRCAFSETPFFRQQRVRIEAGLFLTHAKALPAKTRRQVYTKTLFTTG